MSTRTPAYYKEIETRFNAVEQRQKEFRETQDDFIIRQAQQMDTLNQIHFLLKGTEYEQGNNGGLVGEVKRIKCKVNKNTKWRIMITSGALAISGFIGFVIAKLIPFFKSIKEIINS